jgi:hypothetical protein
MGDHLLPRKPGFMVYLGAARVSARVLRLGMSHPRLESGDRYNADSAA